MATRTLNVSIVSRLKHSALQCFISSYIFRVLSAGSSSWTCQSGSRRGLKIIIDFLTAIKREFYSHVCDSHYIVLARCVEHKYNDVPFGTSQNQRRLYGTFPHSIRMIIIWKSSINNKSVQICFKEIQRKLGWPKMLSETKYARTEKNTVMYFLVRS